MRCRLKGEKSRIFLLFGMLLALLPLLPSACRDPAAGNTMDGGAELTAKIGAASADPSAAEPSVAELLLTGWLSADSLERYRAELAAEAASLGFSVALVRPDPATEQSFLVAAADVPSAEQLNGFFYWFLDLQLAGQNEPPLVLCLDRLFSDATRDTAVAGGRFSDQAVVSLLTFSLRQILQEQYRPELTEFILDCYRRDFSSRQQDPTPSGQVWTQTFNKIEVTYEAAIYSTVTFYALPA